MTVKELEMSCAKTTEIKENFDSLQVSIISISRTLNYVNYSTTMLKGFIKEYLTRIEVVEKKMDIGKQSTKESTEELSEKFDRLHIASKDKPIPISSLFKRTVDIQHPIKPIDKFPFLLPKETTEEKSEPITLSSLFKETKQPKSSESHLFPMYEPLQCYYTRYATPNLSAKGKLSGTHSFHRESHRKWNIDNLSTPQIRQMIDLMFTKFKLVSLSSSVSLEPY